MRSFSNGESRGRCVGCKQVRSHREAEPPLHHSPLLFRRGARGEVEKALSFEILLFPENGSLKTTK